MIQHGHPASMGRCPFVICSAGLCPANRSRALRNNNSVEAVQVNGNAQAVDCAQAAGHAPLIDLNQLPGHAQDISYTIAASYIRGRPDASYSLAPLSENFPAVSPGSSYTQSINNARTVSGAQANYDTQTAEVNQISQATNAPQATVAGLNFFASDGFASGASTPRSFAGSIFSASPSPTGSILTAMNDNIRRRPVLLRSQFAAQNRYDLHHRNPYHSSLVNQSGLRGNNDENDGNYDGHHDSNEEEENNLFANQLARLYLDEDINTAIAEGNDNDVSYFTMRPEESMGFLEASRNDVDAGINQLNLAINAYDGSDTL
ncbi:hypothetical protein ABEW05_007278 [Botrytis cinerea]